MAEVNGKEKGEEDLIIDGKELFPTKSFLDFEEEVTEADLEAQLDSVLGNVIFVTDESIFDEMDGNFFSFYFLFDI